MGWKGFHPLKCLCCCFNIPQRVLVAILMHLCLQNSYNLRVVLNVAIVEMVEHAPLSNITAEEACPMFEYEDKPRGAATIEHDDRSKQSPDKNAKDVLKDIFLGGKNKWPRSAEARILYAFFVGYFVSHVPIGYLADRYGSRHVLGVSMILATIISCAFPYSIQEGGEWAAVGLRFLLGVVQGGILPGISAIVSRWIPDEERPFLGALAYSGSNLGPIIAYAFTGIIIEQFNSWTMPFYVWSACTIVYVILHYFYLFSYPDTHPFVLPNELEYLNATVVVKKRKKTPWKAILTNVPYWANVAGHSGHNYIFYSLVTFMPTYMREILRFDIQSNGLLSALPFVGLWCGSLGIGALANLVINKGYITRYNFGRAFGTMGQWGSSSVALAAVYTGCNREIVVSLFVFALFLKSLYYMTMTNNINELSRNYGGILFAINNGLNSLTGVVGGMIVGHITKNKKLSEWKIVFWITFGYAIFTSIIYIIWTSDKRQDFDYEEGERESKFV